MCPFSTHSVLAARESTQGPDAGKRKRGRPRKVINTDGTELAVPWPLGKESKDASNLEIPQVSSEAGRKNKAVSLLSACYYKRYLY
jgi:AT hook motif